MNSLQFLRLLVIVNGAIPICLLGWDAWRGQLGANSVNQSLHITGILSLVFLFLSLLMTPLRWATGWGGWIAFRRALGLYGFGYAVVHLVIYAAFDRAFDLASMLREIWMRRFLQIGAAAVVLMIPLAITSTNRMVLLVGAKRWKLLHRLAYLVAALGVLHYYLLVKSDVRQPLAFAGVLTLLLASRVVPHGLELRRVFAGSSRGKGDARMAIASTDRLQAAATGNRPPSLWKGELTIAAIFQETPDVKTFRLVSTNGGDLPFRHLPGQFLTLHLTIGGKRVNRSYTIASSPSRVGACEITIKREPLGMASRFLHDEIGVGDRLRVSGPGGRFVFRGDEAASVVLIAGGVGITPAMSIARDLTDRAWPGEIFLLTVARTEQDLIFRDEIEWLQQRFPQLKVCQTLTRCEPDSTWTGERGRPTESLLRRFVPDLARHPVYLCGPNSMMEATRQLLTGLGVSETQIRTEKFGAKTATEGGMPASIPESRFAVADDVEPDSSNGVCDLTIEFARSMVRATTSGETSILEAAETAGVALPYDCRSGVCGNCKTRLIEGNVIMDCEDALSAAEKASGLILACQARAQSNLLLEA